MAAIDSLSQAGIVWFLARVAPDGKGKEKVRAVRGEQMIIAISVFLRSVDTN